MNAPMNTALNAHLFLLPAGVPQGFTLACEEAVRHPRDPYARGALLRHERTGQYVLHSAGANRSVPQEWARAKAREARP